MKYDWSALKKEFITKNSKNNKYTLKIFAEEYDISYSMLRKKAVGWVTERAAKQEQKGNKIIELSLDAQAKSEAAMNLAHFNAAEKLIGVMMKTMDNETLTKAPKSIATLAKALKDMQAVQRIAVGADKGNKSALIDEFIEAVQANEQQQTDTVD